MSEKEKDLTTEKIEGKQVKKEDVVTQEEADEIESIFFEDDETVMLRDGRLYKIHPCTLKDARKLMKLLRTVNIDAIILNLLPNEEDDGEQATEDLFDILLLAFKGYKHIDRDYIDNYVDLDTAREIINIMIGLNGIKKSMAQ